MMKALRTPESLIRQLPARLYAAEIHTKSSMNTKADLVTIVIRAAAVTAGSAAGGFAGKHIGGLAGAAVPVVGPLAGKAAGRYIGAAVGGSVGDAAGETLAHLLLPVVEEVVNPGYTRVDVRPDHHPPAFFEKLTRD